MSGRDAWLMRPEPPLSPVHVDAVESLSPLLIAPFRPEDCERKPLVINNLVYRVDTSSKISFLSLFGALRSVRRKRVKFPQAVLRSGNVDTDRSETLIIYTSGVFVLCGMRNEMTAVRALQMFRIEIQQKGIPIGLSTFTPVNVVVNVTMPFDVDIVQANLSLSLPDSSLTQDDFPGLTFKMRRVQVLAFSNGRCVLTGADDYLEMELVRIMVQDALRPFAVEREDQLPAKKRAHGNGAAGAKNGKRRQKGVAQARDSVPGKEKGRAGTTKTRRVRVATASASLVEEVESRITGRKRGVAFQLPGNLVLRPNEDLAHSSMQ